MMLDIKTIHTVEGRLENRFNKDVLQIVKDLQEDGLVVEVQYRTTVSHGQFVMHSAMIIGRGK